MHKLTSYILIGVLSLLLVQTWCNNRSTSAELARLQETGIANSLLIEELQTNMPDYTDAFLRVDGSYLALADKLGGLTTAVRDIYIPPEGSYEVTASFDSSKIDDYNLLLAEYFSALQDPSSTVTDSLQTEILNFLYSMTTTSVDVTNHGFTVSPASHIGVTADGGVDIGVDTRLYYYNHFGVGLGLSYLSNTDEPDGGIGIYTDYRGFIKQFPNLSIGIGYKYYYPSETGRLSLGVSNYF